MDRRRFVPRPEALEGRTLQANINSLFGLQVNTNLNVPITFQQKSLRIERLPFYLDKIAPHGRFLPAGRDPADPGLALQHGGRDPPAASRRPQQLQLPAPEGGQQPVVDRGRHRSAGLLVQGGPALGEDPCRLHHRHEYGFVQAHIASRHGQRPAGHPGHQRLHPRAGDRPGDRSPHAAPNVIPRIKRNQGIQADSQHIKTPLERPILVGTYHYHTQIQVVTPGGVVVGASNVHKNNNYKVQITTPQSVGVHEFQLRALDDVGHISRLSKRFLIKVVPRRHHH